MTRRAPNPFATLAALAACALLLAFAAPARADKSVAVTNTGDSSSGACATSGQGECSLREAIEYLRLGEPEGEVRIVLAVEGTIALAENIPGPEIWFDDDVESVVIEGPGAEKLTVDGQGKALQFFIPSNADGEITISGLTLAHGGGEEDVSGGAIYMAGSDLTLEEMVLEHNSPEEGNAAGAIFLDGGNLTIYASRLVENEAKADLLGLSGGSGGALVIDGEASDEVAIVESTIAGNKAENYGGGIEHVEGKLRVIRSTISGNEASEEGGGIYAHDAELVVEDSTVAANVSGKEGGGIHVRDSEDVTIEGSTLAANTGAGLYADSAELLVRSTVIAGNERAGTGGDCGGEIDSAGHNLVEEPGSECTWQDAAGDQLGVDPLLGPLAENGGPTLTMAPVSAASPAINQGSHPAPGDQRGRTRPVPAGIANTDAGAVEVQAPAGVALAPPEILGEVTLGSTLTCDPGDWDTDTVTDASYSYEWIRDGLPAGGTATYELGADDTDKSLLCRVTVDNGATAVAVDTEPVELTPGAIDLSPGSLDFGSRKAGSGPSAAQTLTLTNSGGEEVLVTELASSDPSHFPIDAGPCEGAGAELDPGGQCTIEVRFDPSAAGAVNAELEIEGSVGNSGAALTGTGTEARLEAAPAAFDFGAREAGSGPGPEKSFKVSNGGNEPLAIGAVTIAGADPGDFRIPAGGDDCGGATLPPGGRCTVEVGFAPSAAGTRGARLELGGETPGSIALRGTGVAPPSPPGPAPTPPSPPAPSAPVLTVTGASRDSAKLVLTLRCQTSEARCPGWIAVRPADGEGAVAVAEVSPPRGQTRVRLPLTRTGRRLLGADPRALLEVKALAYREGGGKTLRTRYLRLARGSSDFR